MNIYSIQTPFHIELKLQIASFGKRLLAWLIDFVAIYAFNLVFAIFIFENLTDINFDRMIKYGGYEILIILCLFIPSTFYHLIMQLATNGRSLGKYVMQLRVINAHDGSAASNIQLVIRNLLCPVNYILGFMFYAISPIAFIGIFFIMCIFALPDIISALASHKSQKLGDIFAGTIVVQTQSKSDIQRTIFMELDNTTDYQLQYPMVHVLSDSEINGLNKIIQNYKQYEHSYLYTLVERLEKKIQSTAQQMQPLDFFKQIIHDYNYYHQNNQSK